MTKAPINHGGMWDSFTYYELYRGKFSSEECQKIIDLHHEHDLVSSRMPSAAGLMVRNSDLFWIPTSSNTQWIFDRLWDLVALYNSKFGFHLSADMGQAQLTRYQPGQHYDWHMDLGAHQSSLRKITVVVELTQPARVKGGGIEVFYGVSGDNKLRLNIGDVVLFPSFVIHRASSVQSGIRWSLVLWINGMTPLK